MKIDAGWNYALDPNTRNRKDVPQIIIELQGIIGKSLLGPHERGFSEKYPS